MSFFSNSLLIDYDESTKNFLISHPDKERFPQPLVTVRAETYSAMTLDQASEFIGSRILLLIPAMRQHFKAEIERLASSERGKKS